MATPFNDQWTLDRARGPSGFERVGAVTHFDEQGFPLAETAERSVEWEDGVLAALVKHPRWVDRDM
jgi:hypothetical protein